jgi:hypothetical protein
MAVAWLVLAALGLAIHVIIRAGGPLARGARYRLLATILGAIVLASLVTVLLVKGEAAAFSLIG